MKFILFLALFSANVVAHSQAKIENSAKRMTPIMGWASWNNYRININEDLIRRQADAMASNGMKDAGYEFINVDDGFFGGRDESGKIFSHPTKFPSGMKSLATYIRNKGLKPGIYTDAGIVTCASRYDADTIGVGMGLYGFEKQDIELYLKEWDYDFLKVDWCGGEVMELDEELAYSKISKLIYQTKPNAVFNVCRWRFPGKWVTQIADSWRISGDIANSFKSILHIIDLNADLWKYSGPGHFNDMDMLQIGRGMTFEEDKAHFSMWCMMNSPLLAGNDLTTMSKQTLDILTNKDLIAINQDPFAYQARRLTQIDQVDVWARPLQSSTSGKIAVAFLNRSNEAKTISIPLESVGLNPNHTYNKKDLWSKKSESNLSDNMLTYTIAPRSIVVLSIEGKSLPFNVFQKIK